MREFAERSALREVKYRAALNASANIAAVMASTTLQLYCKYDILRPTPSEKKKGSRCSVVVL